MALFYFVRHGVSGWNAENRLCGRTDVALSDEGRRQAALLGERLRGLAPSALYTSPLRRAMETAEILAASVGRKPTVDDRLTELDYGAWEGKTFAEIMAQEGDAFRAWDADPGNVPPRGGESGAQALRRVAPFLDEITARHSGEHEHVIVVCHRTICRLVVCHVLRLSPSEYRRRLSMDNAALNIIESTEHGWRLILFNDTSHLAPIHTETTLNEAF
ncbi:MAG: histidine phosphatase family protein [Terriglobia bacterium]